MNASRMNWMLLGIIGILAILATGLVVDRIGGAGGEARIA